MAIDNGGGGDSGGKLWRGRTRARASDGDGGQTEAHREREGNGPQLPSEARKRERMGGWAAIAWLLTKPDAGFITQSSVRTESEYSTRGIEKMGKK